MIPVYQLGPERKWDAALPRDAVYGRLAVGGHETERDGLGGDRGAVVLAPVGYANDDVQLVDELQAHINPMEWCVVLAHSDETNYSEVLRDLHHPNMRLWLQTPRPEVDFRHDRFLPIGYSPLAGTLRLAKPERYIPWFFQGQVNHERRRRMVAKLQRRRDKGLLITTQGFAQGDQHEYLLHMAQSKVALCPSGPATPDSFRVCEALQMGAFPIVDGRCQEGEDGHSGYWTMVFGPDHPLTVAEQWGNVTDLIDHNLDQWPSNTNRVSSWWQQYKRNLQWRIHDDITEVSGMEPDYGEVTVLIPTSPIRDHPSTAMILETISSVRHWLPDAEILIMCDGVRTEQEHYRANYELYLEKLNWLCQHEWTHVVPIRFEEHTHQAGMTRRALELVRTPTILFVEHDCPLTTDLPMDWKPMLETVADGEVYVLRFHYESHILPVHKPLMVDHETRVSQYGTPYRRTLQWSQRPHLANAAYYRRLLSHERFDGKNMIEDVAVSFTTTEPWGAHRVAIFHPDVPIKRSYTLDGRGDDEKWVDS